jgi:hypothetical protein
MDANEVSLVSIRDLGDGHRRANLTGDICCLTEAGTTMRQRTGEERLHAPLSLHGRGLHREQEGQLTSAGFASRSPCRRGDPQSAAGIIVSAMEAAYAYPRPMGASGGVHPDSGDGSFRSADAFCDPPVGMR